VWTLVQALVLGLPWLLRSGQPPTYTGEVLDEVFPERSGAFSGRLGKVSQGLAVCAG
jgi:hypothetical protein